LKRDKKGIKPENESALGDWGRGRLGRLGDGETGRWGGWGRLKDQQEYFTIGGLALIVKNYWDCQCR
jgi:hypothetical protein